MSRTHAAIVRSHRIGRAGLWAALALTFASGIAAPTAGTLFAGGAAATTVVAADSAPSAGTLGNGWGG